tara:strand:+ start:2965 stop:3144 length:180 start_codon:yes stop_codon:yes gene_type:complete
MEYVNTITAGLLLLSIVGHYIACCFRGDKDNIKSIKQLLDAILCALVVIIIFIDNNGAV